MQKTQNLQDLFLNQTRRERQVVTLFLMNGFQMRGIVRGFDNFTVVLETDGKQQLIYKHAISTLVPGKTVDMSSPTYHAPVRNAPAADFGDAVSGHGRVAGAFGLGIAV